MADEPRMAPAADPIDEDAAQFLRDLRAARASYARRLQRQNISDADANDIATSLLVTEAFDLFHKGHGQRIGVATTVVFLRLVRTILLEAVV